MNEILTMNSRSPRRKFVGIFLCCVTFLELVDKKTFGFNTEIPQGQESKRFSLFHKVKEGEALTGHIISVHQSRSELDCSHKCLSNPKCASFNFEIQQSRTPSTCELNRVSTMCSDNKLQRRDVFAYYELLTPRERPKQEITGITPTTRNAITATVTTQEVSPTRPKRAIPPRSVPSTQPATTAAPTRKCGQDWHAYRSGCLRLFNDHKCWVAAKDHCVKFSKPGNSRLISIYSQDENNQIVRVRSSQGFQEGEYYIGLNDLNDTDTYKWADGTAASFTNWNTGHPTRGKGGGVMKMDKNSGKLNGRRGITTVPRGLFVSAQTDNVTGYFLNLLKKCAITKT